MTTELEADDPEQLLPWYAVERLGHADLERMETALAVDPELARRLDLVGKERAETIAANQAPGLPSAAARANLFARIDAARARTPSTRGEGTGLGPWFGAVLSGPSPRTLAFGAVAAALLIVVQAGLPSVAYRRDTAPGFTTASSDKGSGATGEFALVSFNPGAAAAGIS